MLVKKIALYMVFLIAFGALADKFIYAQTIESDNFSLYKANVNYPDTSSFGNWYVEYAGYGNVTIERNRTNQWLHEAPQASKTPGETHASLITGIFSYVPFVFNVKLATVKQLRTGSSPNKWEVAWVVWNYTDNDHFYYFIPKPNGWELGKRDPTYPYGQRFLATGSLPSYPIGKWYNVSVNQDASNTISVKVNGILVVKLTDTENPYSDGKIGLYTEDAHVHFDNVSVEEL